MSDSYKFALEDAKKELQDIDNLIAGLLPRKERLTSLIRMLEPMVQRGPQPSPQTGAQETINMFGRTEPLWKMIARAMKKHGEPFTLAVAGVEVEKWTGQGLGPNRSQIVRNAVVRHPETFLKDEETGRYTIIGEV